MTENQLSSNMAIQEDVLKLRIEIGRLKQENEQLKAQLEKMKCCTNCKHFKGHNEYSDNVYYCCDLEECEDMNNWELAE